MASLKALKIRIGSVKSTQKITKAMKMVAAAKLRRAQDAAVAGRPYAERLGAVMASLASKVTVSESSPKLLAGTGKDQVHLLVVATSERGLAGAFNTNIVRAARRRAEELEQAILHDADLSAIKTPGFDDARAIADDLVRRYEAGEFDVAHLFYGKFVSALVQEPTEQQIIPVQSASPAPTSASATSQSVDSAIEYEPDEEAILADLLPRNLAIQLFRAMQENQASFFGAQMNAMDNATRNAGDMIKRLSIQYNRTRQAAITTELVEIISGAEAL